MQGAMHSIYHEIDLNFYNKTLRDCVMECAYVFYGCLRNLRLVHTGVQSVAAASSAVFPLRAATASRPSFYIEFAFDKDQ